MTLSLSVCPGSA